MQAWDDGKYLFSYFSFSYSQFRSVEEMQLILFIVVPLKWKFALHYKVAIGRSSHNKMQALPCLNFCEMFMDEDDKRLEALT